METYLVGQVDEVVLNSFVAELYDTPEDYLCPDFSYYELVGDPYLNTTFMLQVNLTDTYTDQVKSGTLSAEDLDKMVQN